MTADLVDIEHLAELLAGGDGAAATPAQLAQLGAAHIQLLTRVRQLADSAQLVLLDLEEVQRQLRGQRAVNMMHRELIASGRLREPARDLDEHQLLEVLLDTARHLAGGDRAVGLLVGAMVTGALLTADPAEVLRGMIGAIQQALDGYHKLAARRAARGATA